MLTAQSATLAAGGSDVVDATAGGIHAAFLVGAVISLAAIPAAFFVQGRSVTARRTGGRGGAGPRALTTLGSPVERRRNPSTPAQHSVEDEP